MITMMLLLLQVPKMREQFSATLVRVIGRELHPLRVTILLSLLLSSSVAEADDCLLVSVDHGKGYASCTSESCVASRSRTQ